MVSDAKAAYLKPLRFSVGMKTLWKNAKSLGLATSNSNSPTPAFTAQEFNVYTSGAVDDSQSSSVVVSTVQLSCNMHRISTSSSCYAESRFSFRNVRGDEIYKALQMLGKYLRCDLITRKPGFLT